MIHPLTHGQIITSPGGHFSYRVLGACCRLFDRDQLPYPCCRLQWRGKEPSWRRIGKRFVLDLASRAHPTYSVEILEPGRKRDRSHATEPLFLTLYWVTLPQPLNEWWYSDRLRSLESMPTLPPTSTNEVASELTTRASRSGTAADTKIEG